VVDFPNSAKAKKYFLCLHTGGGDYKPMAQLHEHEMAAAGKKRSSIEFTGTSNHGKKRGRRPDMKHNVKSKEWIAKKKEKQTKRGKESKNDSKFTGRKRSNQHGF